MKLVRRTSQFKKDVKRMGKRGKKFEEFKEVVKKLATGEEVEGKYQDHYLVGQYRGSRECHIEPDWLLIYELADNELILVRTGTHSDLFR
jgi:mRNA interferase YafQ